MFKRYVPNLHTASTLLTDDENGIFEMVSYQHALISENEFIHLQKHRGKLYGEKPYKGRKRRVVDFDILEHMERLFGKDN